MLHYDNGLDTPDVNVDLGGMNFKGVRLIYIVIIIFLIGLTMMLSHYFVLLIPLVIIKARREFALEREGIVTGYALSRQLFRLRHPSLGEFFPQLLHIKLQRGQYRENF